MDRSGGEVKSGPMSKTSCAMPVSIKAVIVVDGRVLLLANDRGEWELPGGRPDLGESETAALIREIREELGLAAAIGARLGDEPFEVLPGRRVRIVSYGCEIEPAAAIRLSAEHHELLWAPLGALADLPIPPVYRRAVDLWIKLAGSLRKA
jgi:8-oxo-dGTP diphosphatase